MEPTLEQRLEYLERRVQELEARLAFSPYQPPLPAPYIPQWPIYPTVTYGPAVAAGATC